MPPFVTYLLGEVAVIAQAPVAFIAICVAVAVIMYFVVRHQFSDRLASAHGALSTSGERVKLAEERVADYKEKLDGRTPDEAAAKMVALENRLAAIEPYYLSADQLARLHEVLVSAKYGARITRANTSPRLDVLHEQITRAFAKAGWSTQDWVTMGAPKPPNKEVTLAFNSNVPTAYVEAVRSALRAAEIAYGEQEITDEPSLAFPVIWLASARAQRDSMV